MSNAHVGNPIDRSARATGPTGYSAQSKSDGAIVKPPTNITVRSASAGDVSELASALGRAFFDDPLMKWLLPERDARAEGLPLMMKTMTQHHYLAGGGTEVAAVDDVIGAATLWSPPGDWQETPREEELMMPDLQRALGSRISALLSAFELIHEHHPEEPHWYLAIIGSDPAVRGVGFGHALMLSRLDRCDAEKTPAYLESTNSANVPYYERFGFEVTRELVVPGGPTVWAMWRPARM
jgi:ribosomal protein S18 acetylase RimI-like enzyme